MPLREPARRAVRGWAARSSSTTARPRDGCGTCRFRRRLTTSITCSAGTVRTTALPGTSGAATGPWGRGTLLAQDAEQPELARRGSVEDLPPSQGAVSLAATKAVSPVPGATSSRGAVTHLLTSVVRKTARYVLWEPGAGDRPWPPGPRGEIPRGYSAVEIAPLSLRDPSTSAGTA